MVRRQTAIGALTFRSKASHFSALSLLPRTTVARVIGVVVIITIVAVSRWCRWPLRQIVIVAFMTSVSLLIGGTVFIATVPLVTCIIASMTSVYLCLSLSISISLFLSLNLIKT